MIASWELQKSIFTLLSTGIYQVYDAMPSTPTMPYIVVGDDSYVNDKTKTNKGTRHVFTIHTWSNSQGMKETKEMMDFVTTSLESNLTVSGFFVSYKNLELATILKEGESTNLIRHGVVQFQFKLMEE